ncbi:MAG: glycoside hydrolase family 3 C-terminal domain-containing protein [Verrucomicrobia bacterium]|nr:glycoside hydrolase family 3 C-terminal domain-containing protein [Verrucomicrobiota bacterium]
MKTISRRTFLRKGSVLLFSGSLFTGGRSTTFAQGGSLPDFGAMSLEEKVGQLVVARLQDWPLIEKYAKQGIISGMTPSLTKLSLREVAEFTNRFQKLSKYPLLLGFGGVSYSGGSDLRLGQAMRLAATRSRKLCREAARIEAVEARALGYHLAGVPNLDVNTNPDNPIINLRSLGDNVDLVTELGSELARGTLEGGAASLLMHFPGHGASSGDSHIAIPEIRRSLAELEAVDFKPFAEVIRRGLARVVCTNHCHYPALEPDRVVPATLSRKIVTGLLREKLGFNDVIMSDSLTMRAIKDNYGIEEAAIETVAAGHDMILQDYNSDPRITIDALVRAVRKGRIPLAQVEQSITRVWRLKRELGLFANRLVDVEKLPERFATKAGAEVARRIARESVTMLENRGWPVSPTARLAVISNGGSATVEQDLAWKFSPTNHRLNERVRQRQPDARTLVLSSALKPEEIERAFAAAQAADVVVFGLFTRVRSYAEDAIRVPARYRELIARTVAAGHAVALLNFGNPYVMAELPKASVALCTFSDAEASIEAAVETLFGLLKPKGLLPVRISEAYPFGFGLKT